MTPQPGLTWFERLTLDLISEPMSSLTLDLASRLTDRQILDVYIYPRWEQSRKEKRNGSQSQTVTRDGLSPNVIADPDNKGFEWNIPPASEDAELEVHGRKCDAEPFLDNLLRLGAIRADNLREVRDKVAKAKQSKKGVSDATGTGESGAKQ